MKIFEITEPNKMYIDLNSLDIELSSDFKLIIELKELLIKLKRKSNLKILLGNVSMLEQKIKLILLFPFPDDTDPDIIKLKQDASNMLQSLEQIKQEIIAFCK
jgi:hypothetical protein